MKRIKLFIWDENSQNYVFPLIEELRGENSTLCNHYEIVKSIEEADFCVLAMALEHFLKRNGRKQLKIFQNAANKHLKTKLYFTGGDFGTTLSDPKSITIRLAGFKSKMKECTEIMPPFIDDPLEQYTFSEKYITQNLKPTVGFVGHSNANLGKLIKEYILFVKHNLNRLLLKDHTDYHSFYPSSFYRHRYLITIQKNNKIVSNFIFRKKYRAGVKKEEDKVKTSFEFFSNINENLYTFCMRGGGNFSVRLYETLAMGRIPILLDTDCKLPFENRIDWTKHCVIIKNEKKYQLDKEILLFHKNNSKQNLIKMQMDNRLLWKNYFTRVKYFCTLYDDLIQHLND